MPCPHQPGHTFTVSTDGELQLLQVPGGLPGLDLDCIPAGGPLKATQIFQLGWANRAKHPLQSVQVAELVPVLVEFAKTALMESRTERSRTTCGGKSDPVTGAGAEPVLT